MRARRRPRAVVMVALACCVASPLVAGCTRTAGGRAVAACSSYKDAGIGNPDVSPATRGVRLSGAVAAAGAAAKENSSYIDFARAMILIQAAVDARQGAPMDAAGLGVAEQAALVAATCSREGVSL